MTEDYLLQEFHEAGIWLPEELERIEALKKMFQPPAHEFAKQMQMNALADLAARQHGGVPAFSPLSGQLSQAMVPPVRALQNHPRLVIDQVCFPQLPVAFPGQMIPMRPRGFLGSIVGGIFGAL